METRLKLFFSISILTLLFSCTDKSEKKQTAKANTKAETIAINALLDSFNVAAAEAKFDQYFNYFTEDAIYIGTDATENWTKQAYMQWAKPYFDAKKTWNFKSVQRNVYFGESKDIAWFDELLSTQMKICRGSGVVVKKDNQWKVQQYVLSITIPNSQIDKVIRDKSAEEDLILDSLRKAK